MTGDETAFATVVERYTPLLLRHCRQIVGEADQQDALQHAFLNAWCELRRGGEVHALRSWLFTITHHAALDDLRDRGTHCAELSDTIASRKSPAEDAEQASDARAALTAVAQLPEPEREALISTAVRGRSGRATASALGVSEDVVRQLVYRGRVKVRAASGRPTTCGSDSSASTVDRLTATR